jgi:hypothetical protein
MQGARMGVKTWCHDCHRIGWVSSRRLASEPRDVTDGGSFGCPEGRRAVHLLENSAYVCWRSPATLSRKLRGLVHDAAGFLPCGFCHLVELGQAT